MTKWKIVLTKCTPLLVCYWNCNDFAIKRSIECYCEYASSIRNIINWLYLKHNTLAGKLEGFHLIFHFYYLQRINFRTVHCTEILSCRLANIAMEEFDVCVCVFCSFVLFNAVCTLHCKASKLQTAKKKNFNWIDWLICGYINSSWHSNSIELNYQWMNTSPIKINFNKNFIR